MGLIAFSYTVGGLVFVGTSGLLLLNALLLWQPTRLPRVLRSRSLDAANSDRERVRLRVLSNLVDDDHHRPLDLR